MGALVQMLADFGRADCGGGMNWRSSLSALNRPVETDDVKLLVSVSSEALIWNLTGTLSQRNT